MTVLALSVAIRLVYPKPDQPPEPVDAIQTATLSEDCTAAGGTWRFDFGECEYAGQTWCDESGGTWEECASACRHNPDPLAICTMQCVPVCSFMPKPAAAATTSDDALPLVLREYGNCAESGECDKMEIGTLSGPDGTPEAEIIFRGLRDDSVRDRRVIRTMNLTSGTWSLGDTVSEQFICQPGRGQDQFADAVCI
jgi:hypothetical protein